MIMVIIFTTPVRHREPECVAQSVKRRANSMYWAGACIFPAPADIMRPTQLLSNAHVEFSGWCRKKVQGTEFV